MSDSPIMAIRSLLQTGTPAELGPQRRPGTLAEAELNTRLDSLLAKSKFTSTQQQLVRALLLLWHDHLDASHEISQGIGAADGSFVHAIMHRREPDYWNSNYWWRRVGTHPAFARIAREVEGILKKGDQRMLASRLIPGGSWNPENFVACCEESVSDGQPLDLLREVQRIETVVLLDYFMDSTR